MQNKPLWVTGLLLAVYAEINEFLLINFIEPTTVGKITLHGWLGISPWILIVAMVVVVAVKLVYEWHKDSSR